MDVYLKNLSNSIATFTRGELTFMPPLRTAASPDRRTVACLRSGYKSIANRVALYRSEFSELGPFSRHGSIVAHIPAFADLKSEVAAGSAFVKSLRGSLPIEAPEYGGYRLEKTEEYLNEALYQLGLLEAAFGSFHIWIKNPQRAQLESLEAAIQQGEADYEEYVAEYTANELRLGSSIGARDAVTKAIWLGGWKQPKFAGREMAHVRNAAYGIMHGSEDLVPLREAVHIPVKMETGRGVPAFVQETTTDISMAEASGRVLAHPLAFSERQTIDISRIAQTSLSLDAIDVFKARLEGIPYAGMAEHLAATTGQSWDGQRVQAAKRQLSRKKEELKRLVVTERWRGLLPDMVVSERLESGAQVWTMRPPDPELAAVIREGLPFSETRRKNFT